MFKTKIYFSILYYAFLLFYATMLSCFMTGLFKYEPLAILSNSMSPIFSRGDLIILKKFDKTELKEIKRGAIIVYKIHDNFVAHRIIDIRQNENNILITTKGDQNNTTDSYKVSLNDIVGIYKFPIKFLGYPAIWFNELKTKMSNL